MTLYLTRRLAQAVVTMFLVLVFTFVLSRLAGDPTALLLPSTATASDIAAFRASLGLDQPIAVQFVRFLVSVAHLDFGTSLQTSTPAMGIILNRLPATLRLAGLSLLVSLILAMALGIVSELSQAKWIRSTILGLSLLRDATPTFVFGLLAIYFLGVKFHLLPFIGDASPAAYVLPVLTLSTVTLAIYVRLLRSSFADDLSRDYVRTAIAKGSSRWHLITREVLPNILPPFVTVVALNFGALIVGGVLVETVFSWPGVAYTIVTAVSERDFPVIQAGITVVALIFVIVNFAADLINLKLDPRIQVQR